MRACVSPARPPQPPSPPQPVPPPPSPSPPQTPPQTPIFCPAQEMMQLVTVAQQGSSVISDPAARVSYTGTLLLELHLYGNSDNYPWSACDTTVQYVTVAGATETKNGPLVQTDAAYRCLDMPNPSTGYKPTDPSGRFRITSTTPRSHRAHRCTTSERRTCACLHAPRRGPCTQRLPGRCLPRFSPSRRALATTLATMHLRAAWACGQS